MRTVIGGLVFDIRKRCYEQHGVWCNHLAMVGHDFAHSIICTYRHDILELDAYIKGGIL